MSSSEKSTPTSLSPRSTSSSSPEQFKASAEEHEMDISALNFPDFVHYIKIWMLTRLPKHCFGDSHKLLTAFEELFENGVCSMLGVEEVLGEEEQMRHDADDLPSRMCLEQMRSFHQTQFIRCMRQSVWLELVRDVLPAARKFDRVQLPIRDRAQPGEERVDEEKAIDARDVHHDMKTDEAAEKSRSGKLSIKLPMPKMKKGPGLILEEYSLDKGVWCWSSRKTCSKLWERPALELLSPPLTWSLDGQEIHVYHIAVPANKLEDELVQGLSDLADLNIDIKGGAALQRYGTSMRVYYISVTCSEFDCTKKWKPQEQAVCYRSRRIGA